MPTRPPPGRRHRPCGHREPPSGRASGPTTALLRIDQALQNRQGPAEIASRLSRIGVC